MLRKWNRVLFFALFAVLLGWGNQLQAGALESVKTERELRDAMVVAHAVEIEIGGTITLSQPLVIPENKKITIKRGSLAWGRGEGEQENMIIVQGNSTLTLEKVSVNGKNAIGLVYVDSGASLVLEQGATLRGGKAGTAGGVYNKGSLTMNGGTITDCTATNGGAVYNYGEFLMHSGSIIENTAEKTGGGLYNVGKFIIEGGKFADNEAETGKGIYQHKDATRFEVANYPRVSDGIYLAKKQTMLISMEPITTSASLIIEGMEDAKENRVVVTGVREEMENQIVVGFGIAKGYPWQLVRSGRTYVLMPYEERPGA